MDLFLVPVKPIGAKRKNVQWFLTVINMPEREKQSENYLME